MSSNKRITEKMVLNLGKKYFDVKNQQAKSELEQQTTFENRRQRITTLYSKTIFDKALELTGINANEILRRQSKDQYSVKRFLNEQKNTAISKSSMVKSENRKRIQLHSKKYRGLELRRNAELYQPTLYSFINVATEINIIGGWGSKVSIAPENNVAHPHLVSSSDNFSDLYSSVNIFWHFLWTPPREGLLNVISFLSSNGFASRTAKGNCWSGAVSANFMACYINVFQVDAQGNSNSDGMATDIYSGRCDVDRASSGTASGFHTFNNIDTLTFNKQIYLIGQIPTLITVRAGLTNWTKGGDAEINFRNGNFQLNVPFVFLSFA